jgi:hypothetical protein
MIRVKCNSCQTNHEFPDEKLRALPACSKCGKALPAPVVTSAAKGSAAVTLGAAATRPPAAQVQTGKVPLPSTPIPTAGTVPEWYCVENRAKVGPLSLVDLRNRLSQGKIKPSDLVLKTGTTKWVTVSSVTNSVPGTPAAGRSPEAATNPTGIKEWYYVQDRKKVGPVSLQELKGLLTSGKVPAAVMVVRTGGQKWAAANSLPELASSAGSATVPPLPAAGKNEVTTAKTTAPLAMNNRQGWHYVRNKQKVGPVSLEELKGLAARGQLAAGDMVLQPGTSKWVTSGSIAGLINVAAAPISASAQPAKAIDATKEWFYVDQRKKVGPVSIQELKSRIAAGQLRPTDMILMPGKTQWAAANSIPGLFPAAPMPTAKPAASPVSVPAAPMPAAAPAPLLPVVAAPASPAPLAEKSAPAKPAVQVVVSAGVARDALPHDVVLPPISSEAPSPPSAKRNETMAPTIRRDDREGEPTVDAEIAEEDMEALKGADVPSGEAPPDPAPALSADAPTEEGSSVWEDVDELLRRKQKAKRSRQVQVLMVVTAVFLMAVVFRSVAFFSLEAKLGVILWGCEWLLGIGIAWLAYRLHTRYGLLVGIGGPALGVVSMLILTLMGLDQQAGLELLRWILLPYSLLILVAAVLTVLKARQPRKAKPAKVARKQKKSGGKT